MKEKIIKYTKFTEEVMSIECNNTMEVIRKEFSMLDNMVADCLQQTQNKEKEQIFNTIVNMLKNFKYSIDKIVKEKLNKTMNDKKTIFVGEMTKISLECESPMESLKLVQALMKVTDCGFNVCMENCVGYICGRLCALMDAIVERLDIKDEIDTFKTLETILEMK